MPIVPETKDWTWVIERPCPECGFDATSIPSETVPRLLRETAAAWQAVLGEGDAPALRSRPSEDRWSTLEYACHVRDVFARFDERLRLMLAEDDPTFPNWDQDATAVADRYNEQDPAVVMTQLSAAALAFASNLSALSADDWHRQGSRSDGAHFRLDGFARYMIHDPIHHLHDVGSPLRSVERS
ncbi:MAG: DinB family protein [Acidimicrobiales bacterium]|jgi:hypothetical protein